MPPLPWSPRDNIVTIVTDSVDTTTPKAGLRAHLVYAHHCCVRRQVMRISEPVFERQMVRLELEQLVHLKCLRWPAELDADLLQYG